MKLTFSKAPAIAAFAVGLAGVTSAQTTVTSFAPSTNTTPGIWYESTITNSGAATLAELTGLGGDLETNAPLPTGAARLTTTTDNNDRANVGVLDAYGEPGDIFSSLQISYSYHKASNGTQNLSAAPSLKLHFFNANCDDPASAGDCFGILVYEPTWNGVGATSPNGPSTNPTLDTWTTVNIDQDNGLFWWTGGFGQPNTAGGPPVRTLSEWLQLMSTDFVNADLFLIEIGVGSFNQNQLGFFDDVQISHSFDGGYSAWYDFEAPPAVINNDTAEIFTTIQTAIDDPDTMDGHTLEMLVTDHAEGPQINFTKSLTLQAPGGATVRAFGDTGTSGDARGWFLIDFGLTVTFDELTLDGDGYRIWQGVRNHGTFTFTSGAFNDIQYEASGPSYAGTAVATSDASGPTLISDSTFADIGRIGVHVFEPTTVQDCVYTGKGTGDHLDYFVCVGSFGTSIGSATVTGCTVTGNRGVASVDGSTSAGMLVSTFFGAGSTATITGCTMTDNTTGLFVGFDAADTSTVTANQNMIFGNDFGVVSTSTSVAVDALNNWWGDATGPEDLGGTFEADDLPCFPSDFTPALDVVNADGLGNSASDGNVDYCPWLNVPCFDEAFMAFRNGGTNPVSYTASEIVVGSMFTATVDLTTTGHVFGLVIGFLSPLTVTISGGQTLLVNVADPAGEAFAFPIVSGPSAVFSLPVVNDIGLCGLELYSQAIHLIGVVPFELSNALDFTIGAF